jgi:hypothetical protein
MTKLQNHSMCNETLSLRYTRDRDGVPLKVVGDAHGVFDLSEAHEDDVALLSNSPGWRAPRKDVRPVIAPPASRPTMSDAVAQGPGALPTDSDSGVEDSGEDEGLEGPDIDGLRTKAAAMALAVTWRAEGYKIPELDDTMRLGAMKDVLNAALYPPEPDEDSAEGENPGPPQE